MYFIIESPKRRGDTSMASCKIDKGTYVVESKRYAPGDFIMKFYNYFLPCCSKDSDFPDFPKLPASNSDFIKMIESGEGLINQDNGDADFLNSLDFSENLVNSTPCKSMTSQVKADAKVRAIIQKSPLYKVFNPRRDEINTAFALIRHSVADIIKKRETTKKCDTTENDPTSLMPFYDEVTNPKTGESYFERTKFAVIPMQYSGLMTIVYDVRTLLQMIALDFYYHQIQQNTPIAFCAGCGKLFFQNRSDAITCSKKCANHTLLHNKKSDPHYEVYERCRKRFYQQLDRDRQENEQSIFEPWYNEWHNWAKIEFDKIRANKKSTKSTANITPDDFEKHLESKWSELKNSK